MVINKTTPEHVDSYLEDDERCLADHDSRVNFVFLNTNPDAFFVHGDVSIPVIEGHLIHFDGAQMHNTVINSGSVMLLGPFLARDLTVAVGCDCEELLWV
jgi:hypothetical protein